MVKGRHFSYTTRVMRQTLTLGRTSDSEYLDFAIKRLLSTHGLVSHAESLMHGAAKAEPLIALSFTTPQSPPYHGEGPFMDSHVRLMLVVLYALCEGRLHLVDLEEFRRLKGYEGEVQDLEDTIKEFVSLFEVFCLCHDVGKHASMTFSSFPGSRGDALGFNTASRHPFDELGSAERVNQNERYHVLFQKFSEEHSNIQSRALEKLFFETYEIQIHYPGHDRLIQTPVYHALLERFAVAHRLSDRDLHLLEDLIGNHLEFNIDFLQSNPRRIERYVRLANARGYDADDFLDLMQGCIFLDMVCGTYRLVGDRWAHDANPIIECLKSEYGYAPWRREIKEKERREEKKRERNRLLRDVGLDGDSLQELLRMKPGPAFGKTLQMIHEAMEGTATMPRFGTAIDQELGRRVTDYYEKTFQKETDL